MKDADDAEPASTPTKGGKKGVESMCFLFVLCDADVAPTKLSHPHSHDHDACYFCVCVFFVRPSALLLSKAKRARLKRRQRKSPLLLPRRLTRRRRRRTRMMERN